MRIHLLVVLVPALPADKRLVCIAEGLGKHRHPHGNLAGSPINAQLYGSFRLIRIDKRKNNLIRHLIQDTCQAEYQQRQTISKHPLQQFSVQHVGKPTQLRNHAKHDGRGAYQIEEEGIRHIIALHPDIINQVQGYVQEDEQQFERCKLDGSFLIAQISERNALNSIHRHHNHHHAHVPGMVTILQPSGNGVEEQQSQCKKGKRPHTHTEQCRGVHPHRVVLSFIGKAEKARFHAARQQHQQQCHPRIDISHNAIATRLCRQGHGVYGH